MDSNSNNNILSIPLISNKIKDIIFELKKQYEHIQSLNQNFKNYSNSSPSENFSFNHPDNLKSIKQKDIKDYIDKINETLASINEILDEKKNYEIENIDLSSSKEIDSITSKILSEYNSFSINIKEIIKNKKEFNLDFEFNINSSFYESQKIINKIKKKIKKDENEDNIINIQEQRINNNFNRNIDRGHINPFTHRREFNNSRTVVKSSFQYTIEDDALPFEIKFSIFFMLILFVLFVSFMCLF